MPQITFWKGWPGAGVPIILKARLQTKCFFLYWSAFISFHCISCLAFSSSPCFFFFFLFPPRWWTPSDWWLKTSEVLFTKAINVPVLISCFSANKPDTKPSLVDTKILARPHRVSQFADSRGLKTKGACSRLWLASKALFCSSLKRTFESHWIIQLEGTSHVSGLQRLLVLDLLTLTGLEKGVQEDGKPPTSYVWICIHACVCPSGEKFSDPRPNPKNHWEGNTSPLSQIWKQVETSWNAPSHFWMECNLLSGLSFITYSDLLPGLLLHNYLCFRVLVSLPLN